MNDTCVITSLPLAENRRPVCASVAGRSGSATKWSGRESRRRWSALAEMRKCGESLAPVNSVDAPARSCASCGNGATRKRKRRTGRRSMFCKTICLSTPQNNRSWRSFRLPALLPRRQYSGEAPLNAASNLLSRNGLKVPETKGNAADVRVEWNALVKNSAGVASRGGDAQWLEPSLHAPRNATDAVVADESQREAPLVPWQLHICRSCSTA